MRFRTDRALLLAAFLVLAGVPFAAYAQEAPAAATAAEVKPPAVWDIVSIKPHKPGDEDVSERYAPSTYSGKNVSFKMLISRAYNVKQWLIFGLPSWASDQHWDIEAKVSEPDMNTLRKLTNEQRRAMVLALLKDHVGLVAHKESKMQPVFEMRVAPDGAKVKEVPPPPTAESGEKPKQGGSQVTIDDGTISGRGMSMLELADALSYQVERNIVDRTGLKADYGYIVDLHWTPEQRDKGNDNGTGTDAPPPFFEAVHEQLGLKMTPGKAEVPTVVVDHIQMPEAN